MLEYPFDYMTFNLNCRSSARIQTSNECTRLISCCFDRILSTADQGLINNKCMCKQKNNYYFLHSIITTSLSLSLYIYIYAYIYIYIFSLSLSLSFSISLFLPLPLPLNLSLSAHKHTHTRKRTVSHRTCVFFLYPYKSIQDRHTKRMNVYARGYLRQLFAHRLLITLYDESGHNHGNLKLLHLLNIILK